MYTTPWRVLATSAVLAAGATAQQPPSRPTSTAGCPAAPPPSALSAAPAPSPPSASSALSPQPALSAQRAPASQAAPAAGAAATAAAMAATLPQEPTAPAPSQKPRPSVAEPPSPAQQALDRAVAELQGTSPPPQVGQGADALLSAPVGPATLELVDVSLDITVAVGGSTERDQELQSLQGGAHDPRKRGVTLQQAELSLLGAVDPYFSLESHFSYALDPLDGESTLEVEEAFAATTSLPAGLQLKVGHFFTEFGRINRQHPHQWSWQDAPVITSRLFGPDGMRAPGARLSWLTPLPWYSEVIAGVQNANGETMASFLANDELWRERAVGGRLFEEREVRALDDLVYLLRLEQGADIGDAVSVSVGASGLYGPNATGADAETWVYGADLVVKWRPTTSQRGWPFLVWELEVVQRDYEVGAQVDDRGTEDPTDDVSLAAGTLRDFGLYTQALWGFAQGWAAGLRYDYATADGARYDAVRGAFAPRSQDPFRDDRHRVSPLLAWHPSEYSRIRLQYNYDRADHLPADEAHSVWLGFEFLVGAHPAHKY
jgi:hypothetical protein